MQIDIKEVTADASKNAFGFRARSRSLKPIHLAHTVFSHVLGRSADLDDEALDFLERPSKTPSAQLMDDVENLFDSGTQLTPEKLDEVRSFMRLVLHNDNALYGSKQFTAPTCTSDWLVSKNAGSVTTGRYIYTLLDESDSEIKTKLRYQLADHHDGISLLVRPLFKQDPEEMNSVQAMSWESPKLGDDPLADDKISQEFIAGYESLATHFKPRNNGVTNYPRDLVHTMKFGSLAFYLFIVNRHNELRDTSRESKVPIVVNFSNDRESSVTRMSIDCVNTAHSEVENATRLGLEQALLDKGANTLNENEILEQVSNHEFLDLHRRSDAKIEKGFDTFGTLFQADPAGDTFDRLVNALNNAIHLSDYKTFPPKDTVQSYGWRSGLLKPTKGAKERWYEFSPEMIETIVLSILPADQSSMTIGDFCAELRTRYGIIVGGTNNDRDHLDEWNVRVGSSSSQVDPLEVNYKTFVDTLADIGLATRYADGVTIVSAGEN